MVGSCLLVPLLLLLPPLVHTRLGWEDDVQIEVLVVLVKESYGSTLPNDRLGSVVRPEYGDSSIICHDAFRMVVDVVDVIMAMVSLVGDDERGMEHAILLLRSCDSR